MSKRCQFTPYPNHPCQSFRRPCDTPLLFSTKGGKLKPFKVYSYQPLKSALTRLKCPGFLERCEKWREYNTSPDIISDIYDGNVWHNFQNFLSSRHSWCIALNIDWFQPFLHVSDSVGAIYMVILNLPREERYRQENMILAGIIPGPHEPNSESINAYLSPLVIDLKEFYNGVNLPCISASGKYYRDVTVRLALIGVFCDLPAVRKVCGFLAFNAFHGCSRCLKEFPTTSFSEKPDYSGYDTSLWPKRDITIHRKAKFRLFEM